MKKFKNYLLIVCYGLIIFIITRPVPFSGLSTVANISLILIPFIYLFPLKNNETSKFYSIIFIFAWSLTLFFYSVIFCGNDLVLTFRFLIIIVLILIAYFIKLPIGILKLLFYFVAFQCIFLILFELVLMFNFIPFKPSDVRFIFNTKEWGDIYSFNDFFYKIQIKGNALIPFALFLSFIKLKTIKNLRVFRIIFFLGLIVSGNLAYLIALVFFLFFYYFLNSSLRQFHNNLITFFFICVIFIFPVSNFLMEQIEMKKENSLSVRYDQTEVLINDLTYNPYSLLLGRGLGNTIAVKTRFRDYTGDIYYELQALYFMNQMGIVNFTFFLFLNYLFIMQKIKLRKMKIIYFSYILYAITNPYILDTNHVIVILTLVTLDNHLRNENRMHSSTL